LREFDVFNLYRKGQGKWTRIIAAGGVMALAAFGCVSLHDFLVGYPSLREATVVTVPGIDLSIDVPFIISAGLFLIFSALTFFFAGVYHKTCDFLIETEAEMKKVTWPSGSEVFGSTVIVIITVVVFAVMAFLCDTAFSHLVRWLYTGGGR